MPALLLLLSCGSAPSWGPRTARPSRPEPGDLPTDRVPTAARPTADWSAHGHETAPLAAMAPLGDVDGDGHDDVAVGAPDFDDGRGLAYLHPGSAAGLTPDPAWRVVGEDAGDAFGAALAGGDLDGDGAPDAVLGAPGHDASTGRAYVYLGDAGALPDASDVTVDGEAPDDAFGTAVTTADFDDDGYDDLLVGAPGYGTSGRAYVFTGAASGPATSAAAVLDGGGGDFASALSGAGDVNGDGYDDALVGAYTRTSGADVYAGAFFVYHGSATGLGTTAARGVGGSDAYDRLGNAVAAAGDVNGDGYDDVAVGAYGWNTWEGAVYVHLGSASGVGAAPSLAMYGSDERLGGSVAGVGDVDGDGYDDILVGAYAYGTYDDGRAYLLVGAATGPSSSPALTLTGVDRYEQLGDGVAAAGDVDGDGLADLLVRAGSGRAGRITLYRGATTPTDEAVGYLEGQDGEHFGAAVADAGDVDGDGFRDLLVGGSAYGGGEGQAYLYAGSADGYADEPSVTLTVTTEDAFGTSVAGVGDIDGDGYDDVLVGAPAHGGGYGKAALYLGSAAGLSTTPATTITGATSTCQLGYAVAGAGDVDADGYADVVLGGRYCASSDGQVYVYHGSPSGLAASPRTTITGASTEALFGEAVAGAGDVNGDGYDDVLVGQPYARSQAGRVFLYLGSASGVSTTAAATLDGTSASDRFGDAVAGAGDVNSDGYDDVLVGAEGYSGSTGRASLYLGQAGGVAPTAASVLTGAARSEYLGGAVGAAGDTDGDGYADVVVGATGAGGGGGQALVLHGSAAGLDTTAVTALAGATDAAYGSSVAGVGDVDGDGYDDVVVGAPGVEDHAGAVYLHRGYADADGDGVATAEDCDDADATVTAPTALWADADGDGHGDPAVSTTACLPVEGFVADGTDCDDGDPSVHPGAAEVCDPHDTDEDCDGAVDDADDDATGQAQVYADADGDGYGAVPAAYCDPPAGYVADGTDCDDAAASVHPGAVETCDDADTDEDCDGVADEAGAAGETSWYEDGDADGYGGATQGWACDGTGAVSAGGDCDDTDPAVNPGAAEVCDPHDTDEDCDGAVDEAGARGETSWYADADDDGFGAGAPTTSCNAPSGWVATGGDCDDGSAASNPAAPEVCDPANLDEDCDGAGDEAGADGESTWYLDADGDGYGGSSTAVACDPPPSHGATAGDCDDERAAVNPGEDEVCDGRDDDCDGAVDVDAVDADTWYADADGDGYTDPDASIRACDAPQGYAAATVDDCDDTDAGVFPGAADTVDDGIDQDCDGADATTAGPDDTGGGGKEGGCACGATSGASGGWALLMAVLARRGRSQRAPARRNPA